MVFEDDDASELAFDCGRKAREHLHVLQLLEDGLNVLNTAIGRAEKQTKFR